MFSRARNSVLMPEENTPLLRLRARPSTRRRVQTLLTSSWLHGLLVFLPVSWTLHFMRVDNPRLEFAFLYLAALSLGKFIGTLSEDIRSQMKKRFTLWFSVTVDNSITLILVLLAVRNCDLPVAQSLLTGTMLNNLLLTLGLCFVLGAPRNKDAKAPPLSVYVNSSLLFISAAATAFPAIFQFVITGETTDQGSNILKLSHGAAIVLLSLYLFYYYFHSYAGGHIDEECSDNDKYSEQVKLHWSIDLLLLAGVIVLTGFTLQWLMQLLGTISVSGRMRREWIGLVLLPLLRGNMFERVDFMKRSLRNSLETCVKITVGSTVQIALCITPLAICVAWALGKSLNFLFDPFECVVVLLSVFLLNHILMEGKSTWFEGVILIHLYVLVAVTFWFYPGLYPTIAVFKLEC